MLGLWASKRGEPFLCLHAEPCANFRDATVHQDPKRWACGRRYEANPSSVSVARLFCTGWVRVGPCCTFFGREQATLLHCIRWVLVGPCCTITEPKQTTTRPRESVGPCCIENASHTVATKAFTLT